METVAEINIVQPSWSFERDCPALWPYRGISLVMAAARPVASGGMFSTQKASFSKETEQLLKGYNYSRLCDGGGDQSKLSTHSPVMMKEAQLTNFQQRQLKDRMKSEVHNETTHTCTYPNNYTHNILLLNNY